MSKVSAKKSGKAKAAPKPAASQKPAAKAGNKKRAYGR
jgi:hypothetical protein